MADLQGALMNTAGEASPLPALPVKATATRPYENYFLAEG